MWIALAPAALCWLAPTLAPPPGGRTRPARMQTDERFSILLETHGVRQSCIAISGRAGAREMVTTREVAAGETVLRVPRSLLVTAHRSGTISGLIGQSDATLAAAGDLRRDVGEAMFKRGATWDVRLAIGVYDATAGCGGPFWDEYRRLLPLPPHIGAPCSLPPALRVELQDPPLEARANARAALLDELYPSLADRSAHPVTAAYPPAAADDVPSPLAWCYALVTSRCFAMADGDTFAFVPFLDMCQHEASPAANFTSDADGFALAALRPIGCGEPVTISYDGGEYTSRRVMELYGFAPAEGCAADAALLLEAVDEPAGAGGAPLDAQRLLAAADAHRDSPLGSKARLGALYDALDADGAPSPDTLLAAVRARLGAWPTTLEDDEQTFEQLRGESGIDPRAAAVLAYRIGLKRQFALAEAVLATYCA